MSVHAPSRTDRLRPLAAMTRAQADALAATLRHAVTYPLYRERFAWAGLDADGLHDPRALLRLPPFDPAEMQRLANESLCLRGADLAGVEISSGTSGARPKRRILGEEDVRQDAALVARLLHVAGVRPGDRAVAAGFAVDPLDLAFLEGCERLGARLSASVAVTARFDPGPVLALAPSVLLATPSVLHRLVPALLAAPAWRPPRLIVYNGDRLPESTAAALRARGVGLRSLYGLTETSALGISCAAEHGIHLDPARAFAELRGPRDARELVVTTLGDSMPLLRYPTGDLVAPLHGRCPCGLDWPRVELRGRLDQRFTLFDVKFTPEEFRPLLMPETDAPLQILLDTDPRGRERVTFRLPVAVRGTLGAAQLRRRLRTHPQLEYLVATGCVAVRVAFGDPPARGRKVPAVLDRRRT